jgi:hypothetical protein
MAPVSEQWAIANPIALRVEHSSCAWLPASVSGYYYSPVRNIWDPR